MTWSLSRTTSWTSLFAASSVSLDYVIRSDRDQKANAGWLFTVGGRTIVRGELQANLEKKSAAKIQIAISTPPLDDGNALQAELAVAALTSDGKARLGEHRKTFWIFSPLAFSNRSEWLKQLQITLFDLEGKTAKRFDAEKIPYRYVRSAAALSDVKAGVIVIGEHASFNTQRGLADDMLTAAIRGRKVLCLAPSDGQLLWPSPNTEQQAVKSLLMKDLTAVTDFDKRLDAHDWYPGGSPVIASFNTEAQRARVCLGVQKGPGGWPWIEMHFPGGGAIVVCGCGIITRWADSPTPRYLLRAVFERLQPAGEATAREPHAKD